MGWMRVVAGLVLALAGPVVAQDTAIRPLAFGQTIQGRLVTGDHSANSLYSDNPVLVDRYKLSVRAGQRVHLTLGAGTLPAQRLAVVLEAQGTDRAGAKGRLNTHSEQTGATAVRRSFTSNIDQDVLVQVTTPFGPATGTYTLSASPVPSRDAGTPPVRPIVVGARGTAVTLRGTDYWDDGQIISDHSFTGRAGQLFIGSACCAKGGIGLRFVDPAGEWMFDDTVPDYEGGDEQVPARVYARLPADGIYWLRVVNYDEFRQETLNATVSLATETPRTGAVGPRFVGLLKLGEEAAVTFTPESPYEGRTQYYDFTANVQPGSYEVWIDARASSGEGFSAVATWPGGTETEETSPGDELMLFMFEVTRSGPVNIRVRRTSDFPSVARAFTVKIDRD